MKRLCMFFRNLLKDIFEDEGGWTFIETIIVIGIILILTSTVGFVGYKYLDKAKQVTARNQIDTFAIALNNYMFDAQDYPTEEQGLEALWEKPSLSPVPEDWDGPYIDKPVPDDPWGNAYEYQAPGPHGLPFGIISYGADGSKGGEGKNGDIASWEN